MYPSVISALTNPLSSNRLNAPSHSGIETAQNNNITAIQNFIGVEGSSSTVGTLIYDVRSPASNGGGHVQTAIKGGTGQTTFNKGDILVAQSPSVLSKHAVGTDGQILSADSTTADGVNWIANVKPKIFTQSSLINYAIASETSVFSATIPGSTLGISGAVRATTYVSAWNPRGNLIAKAFYGGGVVASILCNPGGASNLEGVAGEIRYTLIGNGTTNSQRGFFQVDLHGQSNGGVNGGPISSVYYSSDTSISSIASDSNQAMVVTVNTATGDGLFTAGTLIEKIV